MDVLARMKMGGTLKEMLESLGTQRTKRPLLESLVTVNRLTSILPSHSQGITGLLELPKEVNNKQKMAFVDEVMELVELENLMDALVGLPGVTGLSTEQWKRLTIVMELVANPSIIFMDETTSGLDVRAAAIAMRTIRNTHYKKINLT